MHTCCKILNTQHHFMSTYKHVQIHRPAADGRELPYRLLGDGGVNVNASELSCDACAWDACGPSCATYKLSVDGGPNINASGPSCDACGPFCATYKLSDGGPNVNAGGPSGDACVPSCADGLFALSRQILFCGPSIPPTPTCPPPSSTNGNAGGLWCCACDVRDPSPANIQATEGCDACACDVCGPSFANNQVTGRFRVLSCATCQLSVDGGADVDAVDAGAPPCGNCTDGLFGLSS